MGGGSDPQNDDCQDSTFHFPSFSSLNLGISAIWFSDILSIFPQRALLQKARSQPSPTLPLPVAGGCPAPALTEEMLLKREERARKRRLQAARRAKEHKNQTIERLTKTAAPSGRGGRGAARGERRGGRAAAPAPAPMVRYSSGAQGSTLSFPPDVPTPAAVAQRPAPSGPAPRCSVPGCPHPRRYACSRTGPLQPTVLPHQPATTAGRTRGSGVPTPGHLRPLPRRIPTVYPHPIKFFKFKFPAVPRLV